MVSESSAVRAVEVSEHLVYKRIGQEISECHGCGGPPWGRGYGALANDVLGLDGTGWAVECGKEDVLYDC